MQDRAGQFPYNTLFRSIEAYRFMKVSLNNLEFFAYHGLYESERQNGGRFIVDVEMEEPAREAYRSLEDVINYETVFAIVQARMDKPEAFIEEVARLILHDLRTRFPQAVSGRVTVTKCAPPIPGMKGQARVECAFQSGR